MRLGANALAKFPHIPVTVFQQPPTGQSQPDAELNETTGQPQPVFDVTDSPVKATHDEGEPELLSEDDSNTELELVRENEYVAFNFLPLSAESRLQLCALLGLYFIGYVYLTTSSPAPRRASITTPPVTALVQGDGNCFFQSVSVILTGSEDQHVSLRRIVCDYIALYNEQLLVDPNYLALCNMRYNGIWATETEIPALASLLRCDIFVYSSVGSRHASARWLRYEPNLNLPAISPNRQAGAIYINHANQNHYEPVLDLHTFGC